MRIEIGTNEAGQRLDKFLRKLLKDVPLSKIFKALRKGDVRVNGKKQKENYALQVDDVVEIRYIQSTKEKPEEKFIKVNARGMKITYEDSNILIVEKWPNILVHPDEKGKEPSLTDYVLSYLNEKGDYLPENEVTFTPAPCNRLDRNTSGIVIFGKNFESLRNVNELIREGNVEKYYNADEYVSRARFFHQAVDVVQQQGYKQYVDCVFYREGEHVANVFSSFYVFVRLRRAYGYCAQGSPYILRTISTASRQAFTS